VTSSGAQPPGASRGSARRRLQRTDAIRDALDRNEAVVLLRRKGALSDEARAVVDAAVAAGVPVREESEREMRRMSGGAHASELIACAGPPPAASLEGLMASDGLVVILAGLRYPGNVGFIVRSAEVAGAAGIVLSNDWNRSQLDEALRVGMRADRFLPVLEAKASLAIDAARTAGRRLVGVETSGRRAPWEIDLRPPTALVVGGETEGIAPSLMGALDDVVRIPTRGFIPSYNVQAAVGILLGEWLRQDGA
jgi:tRNA G18 (ribose-2'-O)-methylase SpoU